MKRPIKILMTIISIVAVAVCILCVLYLVQHFRGNALNNRLRDEIERRPFSSGEPSQIDETNSDISSTDNEETGYSLAQIDFNKLHEINNEIYAWIEIPGTSISYPVLQNDSDDLFYLRRGIDKSYYSGGSIFSQCYNTQTFDDPMTVLYGHTNKVQTMFTELNNFADAVFFDENRSIYIYTPEAVYEYTIFAAFPHSNEHLLLCYDFSDPQQFSYFFSTLTDSINANYRRELFPDSEDRVLTLSTCYRDNDLQRFLVMGVLTTQYDVD